MCFCIFEFDIFLNSMNKKKIYGLFLGFGMFLAVGLRAQNTSVTNDVLSLKETEFDFGSIPQGKPVIHIFEVINRGQDSLKITNVQASCGCTTPKWETGKVFAAGEKTNITVGFNAASRGKFQKEITVTYNNNQTKKIIIKGDVWETPSTSAPENNEIKSLKNL